MQRTSDVHCTYHAPVTRSDRIALLLSLLAILAGYLVADRVFERLAHIEDEMAYLWQAQAIAGGRLTLPSPPGENSFLFPFVIDYHGQRFGKYPLGWPVTLAIGVRLGGHYLVNPLLGGLAVWLTYLIGKRLFGETVALLGALLSLTSPFFLMNTGSLLSHPLGLALSAAFTLGWLDAFTDPGYPAGRRWLPALVCGASLGLLALTRPMTAASLAIPFGLHGLYLLARGDWTTRKLLVIVGLVTLALTSLHFLWQYAVTGDPLLNPYTLWWEYDKVGFGPGYGRIEGGHTLSQAWVNTRFSLYVGRFDLFGWAGYSWLFLPFGLLAILRDRNWRSLLVMSISLSLGVVYLAYWIGSSLFGPRYYYECLFGLALLSAAGMAWLAGWPIRPGESFPNYSGWKRARPLGITALVALLLATNLIYYTPFRLSGLYGLYKVQRVYLEPFLTPQAQELAPALVFVHPKNDWIEYGRLLELENPFLNTPFIFVMSRSASVNADVAAHFPERNLIHYYPTDEPYTFYLERRAKP